MPESTSPETQIARLSLSANLRYFPATDCFIRRIAAELGLDSGAVDRLALIVEEAIANVVEHAFLPGEQGNVDLVVLKRPGQLVVAVEDQGLPFDPDRFQAGKDSGIGMTLMRAFADELLFVNLGKRGMRVELAKNLPSDDVQSYLSDEERQATPLREQEVEKLDTPVTLRRMRADEAVGLSRLVYRVYGYSYAGDFIYYPERIREQLESELLLSWVAVTPDEGIVGHLALTREEPTARIGEIGQAVVDPRFRGRKLFERLQRELLDFVRDQGMYGAYSESVTVHPFTQKGNLALGAREIGYMFGFSPQKTVFKGINEKQAQRQTALLMYRNINPPPSRTLYTPFHHRGMIARIVAQNGLERELVVAGDTDTATQQASSALEVHAQPEWGHALISVNTYGNDFLHLVRLRLRELCLNHIDTIFIDLPLSEPATAQVCAQLEALGFFFAGLVPELIPSGDVLRLQYLNNVEIDPSRLKIASEFGRELLEYVASQMTKGLEI